jgi:hypothetical protein
MWHIRPQTIGRYPLELTVTRLIQAPGVVSILSQLCGIFVHSQFAVILVVDPLLYKIIGFNSISSPNQSFNGLAIVIFCVEQYGYDFKIRMMINY